VLEPDGFSIDRAAQQVLKVDVRLGSKADIEVPPADVRFTPKSGHWNSVWECPLCAKSRHSALQKERLYSITSFRNREVRHP
jgi:hypothetical protein